jgi:hypothetical protein
VSNLGWITHSIVRPHGDPLFPVCCHRLARPFDRTQNLSLEYHV